MQLYNRTDGRILKNAIKKDPVKRITVSFYKYYRIGNPQLFRDHLYLLLNSVQVLGRIYVANEGINAQISVPEKDLDSFRAKLNEISFLRDIRLNIAVDDNGKSFFKLKIKVRSKILADGLVDDTFDVTKIGRHLNATEFNQLAESEDSIIVDMRNHYESEVGHFKNAFLPDADTFREALHIVKEKLEPYRDKHILMYCTGGIRCEKASAYFKHIGFSNVYQLEGGIIKYTHEVRKEGLENRYIGKNFVFDERLGEKITDDVISRCHQCGKPCDSHTNCKNVACNLLFLQCDECRSGYEGCCSRECRDIIHLPVEEQRKLRKGTDGGIRIFSKGRFRKKDTAYFKLLNTGNP